MRGFRNVVALALAIDHDQRRRNHEEFCERINANIQRWEEQLRRNEEAQSRTAANITRNIERLEKSQGFLDRIESTATREWLERTERNAQQHSKPDVRQAAAAKVREHHSKHIDALAQHAKTQSWITEGRDRLRELRDREYELNSKISSARSKL